jgi:ketosteroid isomerase-like protein
VSSENVAIVRRSIEGRNSADFDAAMADADPRIEFDFTEVQSPYAGTYRGLSGARKLWEALFDAWEEVVWEPLEFIELGEHVVVPMRSRFRGRSSGIEVTAMGAGIWTLRDGKVVRFKQCQSRSDALSSLGVAESSG